MGRYDLHAHIEANTPEQLISTLRRIAHHVDIDHDLTGPGEVVNTRVSGTANTPSWSVRVDHDELVSATTGDTGRT